jgi:flagellar basal-body rod protein FlgC
MTDALQASLAIAGSGMEAQSARLRVISENIANAQSTASTPDADPYQRKTISFASELDRALGAPLVRVRNIGVDQSPFRLEYDPGNKAADEKGYVKTPNVDILLEMTNLREANRSYEANLQVAHQTSEILTMTINLIKDV